MSVDITRPPYRQNGNVVRDSSTLFAFISCGVDDVSVMGPTGT